MTNCRAELYNFLLERKVTAERSQRAVNILGGLFTAAETRRIELTSASQLDRVALLEAAKEVLYDDEPGEMRGFCVDSVRVELIASAEHLRSRSGGTVWSTDWPPVGISSFDLSALLFLHYAPDLYNGIFSVVHQVTHDLLFDELRFATLPDGGQLGCEWIVPWTSITDTVLFYLTHTVLGLDEAADQLGRLVEFLPQVMFEGFSLDQQGNTSGELVVIAG